MPLPRSTSDWHRAVPTAPCGTGVLVLGGSSGRVERERAELLARHGAQALSIRWFGGPGQRPAPHEVPVETFMDALDELQQECDSLAIVGSSFGAEAALVTAAHDDRVTAVVAFAPSAVVWGGYAEGRWSSHWTRGGIPLPYVPFDPAWSPAEDPPAYRTLYERSLVLDESATSAATIPVEAIGGAVVLVAGGDDQVWPAVPFANAIAERRARRGLATSLVIDEGAGHRVLLPGESPPTDGVTMARGGSTRADAALGHAAWPHVASALGLGTPQTPPG